MKIPLIWKFVLDLAGSILLSIIAVYLNPTGSWMGNRVELLFILGMFLIVVFTDKKYKRFLR